MLPTIKEKIKEKEKRNKNQQSNYQFESDIVAHAAKWANNLKTNIKF